MAERKIFKFDRAPTDPADLIDFELGGQVFVCKSDEDVSSLEVLSYVALLTGGTGFERLQTVVKLFDRFIPDDDSITKESPSGEPEVVTPSSMTRFREAVRRERVPLSGLMEMASWLLDRYLNFPTRAAESPSSNGSSTGSSSSGAGSSGQPGETSTTLASTSS